MRYPECSRNVIDVTKAPYFADNSGKTDCTSGSLVHLRAVQESSYLRRR